MKKIWTCFILVMLFFIVGMGVMPLSMSYAVSENTMDSASSWAKEEIIIAGELGLLTNSIQNNYQDRITREEFCGLAVKLVEALVGQKEEADGPHPFVDTQSPTIAVAFQLGIVNGLGNNRFYPDGTASRQEVGVMLYRTLKAAKAEYHFKNEDIHLFGDQDKISPWAEEAVAYLYARGVIQGIGKSLFHPHGATTREEAILMVKRVYEAFHESEPEELAPQPVIPIKDPAIASRGEARRNTLETLKSLIAQEMGKPYQWGATGPDHYDCSGLVYSLYGKLGISLPRVSASQATAGTYVAKTDLSYGDLVFFARDGKNVHHVGIYIGTGQFVHAPSTGDVVKVSTIQSGYYANTYYTGRKVIP